MCMCPFSCTSAAFFIADHVLARAELDGDQRITCTIEHCVKQVG